VPYIYNPTPYDCPYNYHGNLIVDELKFTNALIIKMNPELSERIQGILPFEINDWPIQNLTFAYFSMEESLWFDDLSWSFYRFNCYNRNFSPLTREFGAIRNINPNRISFSAQCPNSIDAGISVFEADDHMQNYNYCTNKIDSWEINVRNGITFKTQTRNNILDEITAISISTFPLNNIKNFGIQVIGNHLYLSFDGAPELPAINKIIYNSGIKLILNSLIIVPMFLIHFIIF